MKKTGIVALVAAAALALSACGGSGSSGSDSSAKATTKAKATDYLKADYKDLKDGGTLTLAITELGEQQNPFHQDGTSYTNWLWYWYNPQLALFDDEANYHPNPAYFDDVKDEVVDGNTVVTYKIKDEAVFNDGTPIDVKAFQNTWKSNSGQDEAYAPSSTDGYELIKSVEPGASDKEVVVTFNGVYAWWQGLFNMVLHPSVDTADEYNNLYVNTLQPDLGAGPYKVETFDQASGVVSFVPNEKWWGDKPKLERVSYKQMEVQASLNAFLNKEIDVTSVSTAERYSAVKDVQGINIYTAMIPSNALLTLNSANPILSDPVVREGIFQGVDRQTIFNVVFNGLDYQEDLPGSFTLFAIQNGYEDNFSKAVKYDPEAAQKTLEEGGWVAGSDGIREKDGQKLSLRFVLVGDSAVAKNRATALQQMMKNIGVDLKVEERPSADFSKIMKNRDFDLFVSGFSSTDPFGVAYFGQIYASDSGLNKSGTATAELDAKIKELQKIAEPSEQIAKANELEVEAFKQYGIMPLYNGPGMAAVREGLANFAGNTSQGSMGLTINAVETIGYAK
ncbi:ABC transporter family substrate-binding protein [Arcanobacterium haemolyticum]|nr:ABC transporter family substrate-binding protein [Arcanobacterium haemolyticum]